jgi:hypothetical protein
MMSQTHAHARPRSAHLCLAFLALLAITACTDRREWRTAQAADTLESYEGYLAANPAGEYVPLAQRRLTELKEQRDWRIATELDTADAYRAFIDAHPKGKWVREARIRIQNFLLDPMPPAVEDLRPPQAPDGGDDPLFDAPAAAITGAGPITPAAAVPPPAAPPPAAPPPQATPAATATLPPAVSHRIQLGAFSTREQALAEWSQARARHRELLGLVPSITPTDPVDGRTMWRLQSGVASQVQAREICRVLAAAQQPCVYAPPTR